MFDFCFSPLRNGFRFSICTLTWIIQSNYSSSRSVRSQSRRRTEWKMKNNGYLLCLPFAKNQLINICIWRKSIANLWIFSRCSLLLQVRVHRSANRRCLVWVCVDMVWVMHSEIALWVSRSVCAFSLDRQHKYGGKGDSHACYIMWMRRCVCAPLHRTLLLTT